MSENRGVWGTREDNVWWPGAGVPNEESHHQQLFNQQQLGLVAAHQQHNLTQAQHDAIRSTAAAAQQLFSYKMASSFQNPANAVTSGGISSMRGYDYRGAGGMVSPQQAAQWWYPSGMETNMQNMQNIPSPQSMLTRKMPRVAKDPKPRGRMTAYAFFVQICREEHKKKHPEENVVFAEFSRKCADRWKTMNDKEKKRFHEMADKDKKRYDSEMQHYVPPKGEKVRGKKRKSQKDPNAPKRSLSAFFIFCKDERAKVKTANPDYGVGDIAKELGKRWAEADPASKSKYEAMAEKEKARYDKEMTEYKKKSKLTTIPPPVKPESEDEEEDEEDDEEDDE